jgi:hypothetical protein
MVFSWCLRICHRRPPESSNTQLKLSTTLRCSQAPLFLNQDKIRRSVLLAQAVPQHASSLRIYFRSQE